MQSPKYIRERMHAEVRWYADGDAVSVVLRQSLTDVSYDLPLTLETLVPSEWQRVEVRQGGRNQIGEFIRDRGHVYVRYQAVPNGEVVKLSSARPGGGISPR